MKVFHHDRARSKRGAAVGVLAASMLASVLGMAPAANAIDVNGGCSAGSLRSNVNAANGTGAADSISLNKKCKYVFSDGVFGTDSAMTVTEDLTIYGNGATIEIDKKGADIRHFQVQGTTTLTLVNLTLKGGHIETSATLQNTEAAGSIFVSQASTLIGDHLTVKDNSVEALDALGGTALAGGILNRGTLELEDSTISGNEVEAWGVTALVAGGGIVNEGGTATLEDTTVKGNEVQGSSLTMTAGVGGGIENTGDLTLIDSDVKGNQVKVSGLVAAGAGGGIDNSDGGTVAMTESDVKGNKVTANGDDGVGLAAGGGIANQAGTVDVDSGATDDDDNSSVSSNRAVCSGSLCAALGGGYVGADDATFTFTEFKSNKAEAKSGAALGGGMALLGGATVLDDATITKNEAKGKIARGGGIARFGGATIVLGGSDIFKNKPDNCFNVLGC